MCQGVSYTRTNYSDRFTEREAFNKTVVRFLKGLEVRFLGVFVFGGLLSLSLSPYTAVERYDHPDASVCRSASAGAIFARA